MFSARQRHLPDNILRLAGVADEPLPPRLLLGLVLSRVVLLLDVVLADDTEEHLIKRRLRDGVVLESEPGFVRLELSEQRTDATLSRADRVLFLYGASLADAASAAIDAAVLYDASRATETELAVERAILGLGAGESGQDEGLDLGHIFLTRGSAASYRGNDRDGSSWRHWSLPTEERSVG